MPRGIKKESSNSTAEKLPETWENAVVVGNFSTNKKAWQALTVKAAEVGDGYIPNVVRLGKKWYIAYFNQEDNV